MYIPGHDLEMGTGGHVQKPDNRIGGVMLKTEEPVQQFFSAGFI